MTTEQLIAEVTDAFEDSLRRQLPRDTRQLEGVDPSRIGAQAADWAAIEYFDDLPPGFRAGIGTVGNLDELPRASAP